MDTRPPHIHTSLSLQPCQHDDIWSPNASCLSVPRKSPTDRVGLDGMDTILHEKSHDTTPGLFCWLMTKFVFNHPNFFFHSSLEYTVNQHDRESRFHKTPSVPWSGRVTNDEIPQTDVSHKEYHQSMEMER